VEGSSPTNCVGVRKRAISCAIKIQNTGSMFFHLVTKHATDGLDGENFDSLDGASTSSHCDNSVLPTLQQIT